MSATSNGATRGKVVATAVAATALVDRSHCSPGKLQNCILFVVEDITSLEDHHHHHHHYQYQR